jgi:hypothetical protein
MKITNVSDESISTRNTVRAGNSERQDQSGDVEKELI